MTPIAPIPCLPLRRHPGANLRRTLESTVADASGAWFVVSGIGRLLNPQLRFVGADQATRLVGPFEILSLSGCITPQGAHLHMAIADDQGRVYGGHVGCGNTIRTTAEVSLVMPTAWSLSRVPDASTGFAELLVTPLPGGPVHAG